MPTRSDLVARLSGIASGGCWKAMDRLEAARNVRCVVENGLNDRRFCGAIGDPVAPGLCPGMARLGEMGIGAWGW